MDQSSGERERLQFINDMLNKLKIEFTNEYIQVRASIRAIFQENFNLETCNIEAGCSNCVGAVVTK